MSVVNGNMVRVDVYEVVVIANALAVVVPLIIVFTMILSTCLRLFLFLLVLRLLLQILFVPRVSVLFYVDVTAGASLLSFLFYYCL